MNSPLTRSLPSDFLYQPGEGLNDEVYGADGQVRDSWRYILESLTGLGSGEFEERQKKALRILRDDGATYNIYNDDQADKTWKMDLLPWVIDSTEWATVEAGLQERAELFNLILQDIYTDRELITRGIVPPELIFGHRGFLRACQGTQLPGQHQLIIHSADMVRREDGSMCVLADRTQAPSGAGYALENRTVMSRVFPSLFRDSHVHRLALFFQNLRQKLIELAPRVALPRIVVLTPGAYNETYFEHSYLANYLGFSLVQSSDLLVRENRVWMRSLDGLKRVDVILRRVDDYFCDQVELKGDSQLGIPGLIEVIRTGNVTVANPLGSGVLEHPALLKYLPAIGRHFMGREPRLGSVATWWCGDQDDLDYVLNNMDDLVIKPVFRVPGSHSQVISELNEQGRKALKEKMLANPGGWVAQEKLLPSHLPVFDQSSLQPRPAVLRSFAVAADTSYRVLPGGLTRVGTNTGVSMVSNQAGSVSKDTWVLASEPEKQVSLAPLGAGETAVISESSSLPSRVVENLFWLGRYAERAENGLRLMRTVFVQTNGVYPMAMAARRKLLESFSRVTDTLPGFIGADEQGILHPENELLSVILDKQRSGSISFSIEAMLACAEETKELLSSDTQRIINDIRDQANLLSGSLQSDLVSAPEETLDPLVSSLLSMSGIIHESMLRGMGWRFMDMGRRLERAMQTVVMARSLMSGGLAEAEEAQLMESLLLTSETLISYRRRYRTTPDVRNVLELILIDTSNPRSLLYQLERLDMHMDELPQPVTGTRELEGEARYMLEALTQVRLSELSQLSQVDIDSGKRNNLDQLLGRVHYLLSQTYSSISDKYFAHVAGPQQLVRQSWESD